MRALLFVGMAICGLESAIATTGSLSRNPGLDAVGSPAVCQPALGLDVSATGTINDVGGADASATILVDGLGKFLGGLNQGPAVGATQTYSQSFGLGGGVVTARPITAKIVETTNFASPVPASVAGLPVVTSITFDIAQISAACAALPFVSPAGADIPTLSEWVLAGLVAMLGTLGVLAIRRRRNGGPSFSD